MGRACPRVFESGFLRREILSDFIQVRRPSEGAPCLSQILCLSRLPVYQPFRRALVTLQLAPGSAEGEMFVLLTQK